jgi:hypothetical protein
MKLVVPSNIKHFELKEKTISSRLADISRPIISCNAEYTRIGRLTMSADRDKWYFTDFFNPTLIWSGTVEPDPVSSMNQISNNTYQIIQFESNAELMRWLVKVMRIDITKEVTPRKRDQFGRFAKRESV